MAQDLSNISRDAARLMAGYVGGSFFSFSSVNRRLLGYFQQERQAALKKVKILVKENGGSSFLLTFEGKLYACGQNKDDHFGLGDKKEKLPGDMKCYRQWTRIGPTDRKISEVVLDDENSVFVRCDNEWFGAGSHPYIQQAQRRDKSYSPWVCIAGPEPFSIVELIPTATSIFIRCRDNFCYAYGWDKPASSKIYWNRIGPPQKKTEKMVICEGRVFLQCSDGWYGCGENKNGELGLGFSSDWTEWIKIGPKHKKVLQLKANQFNTFVYCDDGKWYGCGGNERGQLGTGNIEIQFNWIQVGPNDKKKHELYVQNGRTFVVCSDRLYMCGANDYKKSQFLSFRSADYLNWVRLNWDKGEILNVMGKEDVIFVQCREGWCGFGPDNHGILGWGYETHGDTPKKLNCFKKSVVQIVPSVFHIFVSCEDGWYFSGRNYEGQNGINDGEHCRYHWVKVLNHEENIEQAVSASLINEERIKSEPTALRFRRALRKLYDPYYISILENMLDDYVNGILKIGYHSMYEDKYRFFLFLDAWDFNNLSDSHVDELPWILKNVMGFSSLIFLADEHFNGGGFPWHLRGENLQNYPFPTHWVDLRVENQEAICQFLDGYERMLDEFEFAHSGDSNERRSFAK